MFDTNEAVELLREIRDFLESIDEKLDDLKDDSSDIRDKVGEINGSGLYSLSDIFDKLTDIEISVDANSWK